MSFKKDDDSEKLKCPEWNFKLSHRQQSSIYNIDHLKLV